MQLQEQCDKVSASDALLNYILALVNFLAAKVIAWVYRPAPPKPYCKPLRHGLFRGRHYLVPEDVQAVFCCVAEHRLRTSSQLQGEALSERILASVNPIM